MCTCLCSSYYLYVPSKLFAYLPKSEKSVWVIVGGMWCWACWLICMVYRKTTVNYICFIFAFPVMVGYRWANKKDPGTISPKCNVVDISSFSWHDQPKCLLWKRRILSKLPWTFLAIKLVSALLKIIFFNVHNHCKIGPLVIMILFCKGWTVCLCAS